MPRASKREAAPARKAGRALGVDRGGTWLRVCLAGEGKVLARARLASAPVQGPALARALRGQLRRWGRPKLARAVIGARGVWTRAECRALERRLSGLAPRVKALSDAHLAHLAALRGGPGVLVVAGTGSIAVSRAADGRFRRAGGLGPLFGDEGSGFWVGRRGLMDPALSRRWPRGLALSLAHSPDPVSRTAALAKRVLGWAARGDRACARIRAQAARELARLAQEAAREAGLRGRVRVSWHGSLLADRGLLRELQALLRRRGFVLIEPRLPPDVAAATLP